jgi:hypothetical protein
MTTELTREIHEAGYQAANEVVAKQRDGFEGLVMQLVPLRQGMQQSKTPEELFGYVRGASRALILNPLLERSDVTLLNNYMSAYLDGVYKNLGMENPLKGRGL